ncbi:MAG: hypothetical protein ACSHX6_06270 [Akkermansiaceae bacterium]
MIGFFGKLIVFWMLFSSSAYAKQSEVGVALTEFLEVNRAKEITEVPKEIRDLKVTYLFRFSSKPLLPTEGDEDVFVLFLKSGKFSYRYLFSVEERRWDRSKSYSVEEVLEVKKIVEYAVHEIEGSGIRILSHYFKKLPPKGLEAPAGTTKVKTMEDYENLVMAQRRFESEAMYSSEQLVLLRKLFPGESVSEEEAGRLLLFKGRGLGDFVSMYGFPALTRVHYNLRKIDGGLVIWRYAFKGSIVFELGLKRSETGIVIGRCYFFDLDDPRRVIEMNELK